MIFSYEFKTNHEEWIKSVKPRLGRDVSDRVHAAINTTHENIKILYKVRTEIRAALHNLLKVFTKSHLHNCSISIICFSNAMLSCLIVFFCCSNISIMFML